MPAGSPASPGVPVCSSAEPLSLRPGRHQDVGAVLVSIGASYDAAQEGRTHQAPEDVALLATLPGWHIHVPPTATRRRCFFAMPSPGTTGTTCG